MAEPRPDATTEAVAFPTLSEDELGRVADYGRTRATDDGEVLFAPGDDEQDFYVLLDAEVVVVHDAAEGEEVIARHGPGQFVGELSLLSGARPQLTARVERGGRLVQIEPDALRRLLDGEGVLARTVIDALLARRALMQAGGGARTLQILGSRYDEETARLRRFVTSMRLPHVWEDLEEWDDLESALARYGVRPSHTPVVVTPSGVLRRPSPERLADFLGLTFEAHEGEVFDLVVVGAGPGGLAAAVYGASEGIDTLVVDDSGPGGQAGTSAMIENYLGFPSGISGVELTDRAAAQALKFGARLTSPCEATALEVGAPVHVVRLGDGTEIPARAVVIATGARYRRPEVDGWDRFEGRGVYYAATDIEARSCDAMPVVVLGGGNSAGQAAMFLAARSASVEMIVRREDLAASMSRYLVERIGREDRITVRTRSAVTRLEGDERLERVVVTGPDGETVLPCSGLFAFIGAEAATAWLPDEVRLDRYGFVLTDRDLVRRTGTRRGRTRHRPLPFETSVEGVFAVGDVRHGSGKRVAAAVGEGSSVVRSVHRRLAHRG